jgi:catechol 2,3-dioxygenase
MLKLERLGHCALRVADLERSKAFYTDVLGFELLEQDPEHGGVFLALNGGGNTLVLLPAGPDARPAGGQASALHHLAFAVGSEDALTENYFKLVDLGVEVVAALDHESQHSVYFLDPDHNLLEVYWELPNARQIFAAGRGDEDKPLTFVRP